MVATRGVLRRTTTTRSRVPLENANAPSGGDDVEESSATAATVGSSSFVSLGRKGALKGKGVVTGVEGEQNPRREGGGGGGGGGGGRSTNTSTVMTRKRRLISDVQAHLAIGIAPYWESGVDLGADQSGARAPRRSRRGEARRKYEDAAGVLREHLKMEVNLPPMVNTREGKLLAVEVFGSGVLQYLPTEDRGTRVGHCSSGYVCGYPVPRGKEGNSWCQTPVRASLESKMACKHHSHLRRGTWRRSPEQLRYMVLADQFYDQQTGDICWQRVVSFLRKQELPAERGKCRQVLTVAGRAVAVTDTEVILHGFAQCLFFWLAACRLTRRGYKFTMVAHASKMEFKEFLAELRSTTTWPLPSQASSPFVCLNDRKRSHRNTSYYASGYDEICRMF